MQPSRPGMPSSYSGRQKLRQTAAPASISSHPSARGVQAAPLVARTTSGAIRPLVLSRSPLDVFLPVRRLSVCAFSPRPRACSTIRALTHLLSCSPLARRSGSPPSPSIPPAFWLLSRPVVAPATLACVAEIPSRFPAGSTECDRRTAAGTSQTNGRGAQPLPRASLRTYPPSTDTLPAARPQILRKFGRLPLRRRWRWPESLFPSILEFFQ